MLADALPVNPDTLQDLIAGIYLIRLIRISTCMLTIYDHFITLDQEIELIWRKRWSLAKVLYIWNRYVGDALMVASVAVFLDSGISLHVSKVWSPIQAWISLTIGVALQGIMQLRIYALYNRSRPVTITMVSAYIIQLIALIGFMIAANGKIVVQNQPIPGVHMCIMTNVPSYYFAFWLCTTAFDALLFGLAAYEGFKDFSAKRRAGTLGKGKWLRNTLMGVLLRDTFTYYLIVLALYIANAMVWMREPASLYIPQSLLMGISINLGCKLVLNLRELHYSRQRGIARSDGSLGFGLGDISVLRRSAYTPSIDAQDHGAAADVEEHEDGRDEELGTRDRDSPSSGNTAQSTTVSDGGSGGDVEEIPR
ncbi:hypothetical protein JAAARDRAFT_430099 [Jaapia argillacea MUCL 33604]|uniref:DUF6533 domain-containing protein n=1 Tax=Jaapia argillacea MUCL 33604 TaxID=933084 RepID=A0A067PFQ5_9AGAM|nr:hypothetical protein JAAARDRAFT_430099 [Jaapia argillacea MUCL 33604]